MIPRPRPDSPAAPRVVLPAPRRSWGAAALSALAHLLLLGGLFLAGWLDMLDWQQVGGAGDPLTAPGGGGGGGGGSIRAVALPTFGAAPDAVAREATPPPEPVPEPVPVEDLLPPPEPEVVTVAAARPDTLIGAPNAGLGDPGSGGGRGSGRGTGDGSGTGPGSGSGSGGGEGAGGAGLSGTAPVPRQVILPPLDYPRTMRGLSVAVTFWVGADGRVRRVELEPEIADRGFARRFRDVMMQYRFRPARSAEGAPIAGTTTVTIAF